MNQTPPNQPLELSIPDAAQSVILPLCLLSRLAAQWHVRRAQPRHLNRLSSISGVRQ